MVKTPPHSMYQAYGVLSNCCSQRWYVLYSVHTPYISTEYSVYRLRTVPSTYGVHNTPKIGCSLTGAKLGRSPQRETRKETHHNVDDTPLLNVLLWTRPADDIHCLLLFIPLVLFFNDGLDSRVLPLWNCHCLPMVSARANIEAMIVFCFDNNMQ